MNSVKSYKENTCAANLFMIILSVWKDKIKYTKVWKFSTMKTVFKEGNKNWTKIQRCSIYKYMGVT